MRLGLIPAPGAAPDGALTRELAAYAQAFGDVRWFDGGRAAQVASSGMVVWNGAGPSAAACDVLSVLNLRGVWPALRAKARGGVPYVLHLGYDHARLAVLAGKRSRALGWRIIRRVSARHAASVVIPSEGLARRWNLERSGARVRIVPYGVLLDRFWPSVPMPPRNPANIITVARLSPEKNLGALIDAARNLGAMLTIVGEGPLRSVLVAQAREARIHTYFTGQIRWEAVGAVLREAHAFALPSFEEGSPKALLEAMGTGLPCVASTAIPLDQKVPVLRANPRSVADLRASLKTALDAPEIGVRTRAWVEKHHDLDKQLAIEVAVIREAAR